MKTSRKAEKYYFAYGSNLHKEGMKNRCPDSEEVVAAFLEGYELLYRRVATIEKSLLKKVPGAVYKVSKKDEENLDLYEAFPMLYRKETVKVKGNDGEIYTCFVYIMNEEETRYSPPNPDYFDTIRTGYAQWGLPDKILAKSIERTTEKL